MSDLTPAEQSRITKRIAIFTRRGWKHERAKAFAERLAARDRGRDERRACIECAHLRRDQECDAERRRAEDRKRGLAVADVAYPPLRLPVTDQLMRCSTFEWTRA